VASTKIVLPEDEHWETTLYSATMNNAAEATNVSIVACHNYDGNNIPAALPTYDNPNAALWETEVSTIGGTFDGSISNAVYWAGRIHLFMTTANANAWHFWWLISGNPDNEGLTDINGYPAMRMYALGNFSRFVLPGFYRIGASGNAYTSVSAYANTNSGNFAIVAINANSNTVVQQTFDLTNFNAASVTPWITSGTYSLVNQAPVAVANSSFTYSLPPLSVVTFAGQSSQLPPGITISNAALTANGLVLTWNSFAGATYSVLQTNTLANGGPSPTSNWNTLITGYPAGGAMNGTLSYTDTTANASVSASFYQVSSP
jgi:glucuronoarabinoxylan endo-1,4-beta-xylanase